jgi:hypothetical protein
MNDLEVSSDDELPIEVLVLLLQAALVLEHQAAAEALAARLACVAHLAIGARESPGRVSSGLGRLCSRRLKK